MYVRLATKGTDYAKCSRAAPIQVPFEYPTIMAERELKGELLGYLTTNTKSGYIVAGPLWILDTLSRTGKGLVLLRLMTGYENTLAINHIDRFLFWISPGQEHYIATIKKAIDLDPFEVDEEGNSWFRKMIAKETIE
jgi:hypothetical protein